MAKSTKQTGKVAKLSPAAARHQIPSRTELMERAESWADRLLAGPITFFPVRHHSPACSFHLRQWIQDLQPQSIIIEGPCSLNAWIPSLLHKECLGPVAILMCYRESERSRPQHDTPAPTRPASGPLPSTAIRHSAFFPLCDYSPEWVALRQGAACGANVQFADLEFADKIRWQQSLVADDTSRRSRLGVLLSDESNLRYSQFIERLTRKMGCRDFDELWDHLFEANAQRTDVSSFLGLLAAWCDLARASHDDEALLQDATVAREATMAKVIRDEYQRLEEPNQQGSILVVTGGFHTVALPDLVAASTPPQVIELPELEPDRTGSWLIRYSYPQLDALNGYRSGMKNPGFYDALWQAGAEATSQRSAIARMVSTVARQTREHQLPYEASVTDSIAALSMLDQLSELRSHAAPTRNDLLDAVLSTMSKESAHASELLAQTCQRILAGDRIGQVPPTVGSPPLVHDFQRLAATYRLPTDSIDSKHLVLELYRKPKDRPRSFFLHQLQLLGVPYAELVDGPDFIHGLRLRKLHEDWNVTWSPTTEARLAEASLLGETVAEAASRALLDRIDAIQDDGSTRSAVAAVDLLIQACRCGLHSHLRELLPTVERHISEDGVFASVAQGLSRLSMLKSAREPLEANRLHQIDRLIHQCYTRSCHLIDTLCQVPDEFVTESLDGLLASREFLTLAKIEEEEEKEGVSGDRPNPSTSLDASLFYDALERILLPQHLTPRSEMVGAAAGLLYACGRYSPEQVCETVKGQLDAAVEDVEKVTGVVRGLMAAARETFWQLDELLQSLDRLFACWEDLRFTKALPSLRLAFAELAPQEVDRVAGQVSKLHGESLGPLIHPDVTEEEAVAATELTAIVRQVLQEEGETAT